MKCFIMVIFLSLKAASALSSFDDEFVVVGDVAIPKEEYKRELLTRAGVTLQSQFWPNGIVYYTINKTTYNTSPFCIKDGYLQSIYAAFKDYHTYTCIKFVEKDDDDDSIENWVRFDDNGSGGCVAERVGFSKKRKIFKVNLENIRGYCPLGTITHEIGHLLGLSHEHTREDRDYYITIHPENIKDGKAVQFVKDNNPGALLQNASYYGVNYNYASMMHYPDWFEQASEDVKTMTSNYNYTNSMGNPDAQFWGKANGITKGDQKILNKMYNCTAKNYPKAPLTRLEKNPLCPGNNGSSGTSQGAGCKKKKGYNQRPTHG